MYSNARDLARFGLLHLQQGNWRDSKSSPGSGFVRSPPGQRWVMTTAGTGGWCPTTGNRYPLTPSRRRDRGQYVIVVPSHDLVIRRGLDYGNQGFDPWAPSGLYQGFRVTTRKREPGRANAAPTRGAPAVIIPACPVCRAHRF